MRFIQSNKQFAPRPSFFRPLFSFGLPLLLLLIFLLRQLIDFDSIGWSEGFSHPLSGWDHLGTMIAVGIWAAQLRGQAIWMLPMAFVGVMTVGGLAGAANLAIPSVEGIILLSTAVFSVLITRKVRFNTHINVLIVAFFAFFHGFAHGHEISTSSSLISYTLGFMLATLLLHGSGILLTKLIVLSITFMMTAMFSGNALAKAYLSASEHDNSNGPCTSFLQIPAWSGYALLADLNVGKSFNSDSMSLQMAQRCHAWGNVAATDNSANIYSRGSGLSDALARSSTREVKPLKTLADFSAVANKASHAGQVAIAAGSSFNSYLPVVLRFKYYFPDINHTPGIDLSSGGVGLTSPPVISASLVRRQAAPNLHNPFEAHSLQANHAKVNFGKNCINSHQDYNHDRLANDRHFLVYFQSVVLGVIDAGSLLTTDFIPLNFPRSVWANGLAFSQSHSQQQPYQSSA